MVLIKILLLSLSHFFLFRVEFWSFGEPWGQLLRDCGNRSTKSSAHEKFSWTVTILKRGWPVSQHCKVRVIILLQQVLYCPNSTLRFSICLGLLVTWVNPYCIAKLLKSAAEYWGPLQEVARNQEENGTRKKTSIDQRWHHYILLIRCRWLSADTDFENAWAVLLWFALAYCLEAFIPEDEGWRRGSKHVC